MTVRALDANGDIVTSGNHFVNDAIEVAQTIETRLRLFAGEYFRDITDGTDWFGKVLTKRGTLENKDSVIQNRIRQTKGVLQILSFDADFNLDTRAYTIDCSVLTTFGEVNISTASDGQLSIAGLL